MFTKKRALLIGINYTGTNNALRGCINDIHKTRDNLIQHFGFDEKNIVLMFDENQKNPSLIPTKENIKTQIKNFVNTKESTIDAELVFQYSGHGGQVPDDDGDEIDGKDECLFPLDFTKTDSKGGLNVIRDDEFRKLFSEDYVDESACITFIIDACHSGTMGDERYNYTFNQTKKSRMLNSLSRDAQAKVRAWNYKIKQWVMANKKDCVERMVYNSFSRKYDVMYILVVYTNNISVSVPTAVPTSVPTTVPTTVPTAVPTAVPTVVPTAVPTGSTASTTSISFYEDSQYQPKKHTSIMISMAMDFETAADAFINNKPQGAGTALLWKIMEVNNYELTLEQLLLEINKEMKKSGYTQTPKLSTSKHLKIENVYFLKKKM
jgi:hypothetical protein